MLAIFIGILAGMGIGLQTAINSRLRHFLGSPFLASLVSFSVGAIALLTVLIISDHPLLLEHSTIINIPWWAWFGGLLGMIGLTSNVLLFPKLGGVQTAVMPILGQVLMGSLIDTFGWFHSPQADFSFHRLIGLLLVLFGVFTTVVLPHIHSLRNKHVQGLWRWQLAGIIAGMVMAAQTAINGELGRQLHSATYAATISMLGGMLSISLIVLFYKGNFSHLTLAVGKGKPYWIWFGGILGAIYISVGAWLVQIVGTGGTVVLMLCGLISMSLLIDKFGWLGVTKKVVQKIQLLGLFMLLSGVACIHLL
ncbi:Integral membrane protein [Bibersteinia trehalosi USDA-ARS-USMARC-190]|uniref:Integral membrane protein n=1 Tax=Bibersteinia trehalosi USDA-ARS-USMARC-190 TaxID=1263832 RepID=W0R5N8_BIBTR|nr:DMT family transporter [Bibersteinia trehalosi]AHG85615.1 Integral membrane protein [Bibersteinia trehalosi USDA-ARS-USMARC-190]